MRHVYLLSDYLADLRIAVPQGIDRDPCREVEVSPEVHVPEIATLAPHEDGWGSDVCFHHIRIVVADQLRTG